MTPTKALSFSHKNLVGPHHREITQQSLVCETPSVSRSSYDTESLASWELLVHLAEESPGHFRTKGNICSLLKTQPQGYTLANVM